MRETPEALARALEIFDYLEGMLFWKEKTGKKVVIGNRAGCPNPTFIYRDVNIDGVRFKEHRVIWAMHNGAWPKLEIDHINHIRDDNKIENLRDITPRLNQLTKPISKNNTSGHKGIRWRKDRNIWQAYSSVASKFKNLGHFISKEEAIIARTNYEMSQ